MNLSKNNLFARYYQWILGSLPNDVCSFFWGSVLIIGLSPILIVGRLFTNSYNVEFGRVLGVGLLLYFLYSVITLIGLIAYANFILELGDEDFSISDHYHLLELSWYGLLLGMPLVTIGIIIGFALLVGTPLGIGYGICKLLGVTVNVAQKTTLVQNTKDFIGAIRGKYCTKITWK